MANSLASSSFCNLLTVKHFSRYNLRISNNVTKDLVYAVFELF